jgi:acetaldehyde dehydrogenase (acetylating)
MEIDRDLGSIQEARNLVKAARRALDGLRELDQGQVDTIVNALRQAGEANACRLAQMAVSETGMGNYEDKCFKNFFAARFVFESIQDMKTVGIIKEDKEHKIWEVAEPAGVIAGIVPTTNPTSTVIYKSMIALKSRNPIVFSPHPSAIRCTIEAARVMNEAAVAAGAPQGVISCLSTVSMAATQELMKHPETALILATGGTEIARAHV